LAKDALAFLGQKVGVSQLSVVFHETGGESPGKIKI